MGSVPPASLPSCGRTGDFRADLRNFWHDTRALNTAFDDRRMLVCALHPPSMLIAVAGAPNYSIARRRSGGVHTPLSYPSIRTPQNRGQAEDTNDG
jgi:hypothetical protein